MWPPSSHPCCPPALYAASIGMLQKPTYDHVLSSDSHALEAASAPAAPILLRTQSHRPCLLPTPSLACSHFPCAPCSPRSPARPDCMRHLDCSSSVSYSIFGKESFLKPVITSPTILCSLCAIDLYPVTVTSPGQGWQHLSLSLGQWLRVSAQELSVK